MSNPATLIPIDSHERAVELGRRGGIASGKARARQKSLRELLLLELEQPYEAEFPFLEDSKSIGLTKGQKIVRALVDAACNGPNVKAQLAVFKLLGGSQTDADVDDADGSAQELGVL